MGGGEGGKKGGGVQRGEATVMGGVVTPGLKAKRERKSVESNCDSLNDSQ